MTLGSRTCSIAMAAAPVIPARSPKVLVVTVRWAVAQGGRPPVHHLPYPGEEVLAGLGDVAAYHDALRVEDVDHGSQHLPDPPPRLADGGYGDVVAGVGEPHHVAAGFGVGAAGGELLGQRPSAGDRLEAAVVAAAAEHPFCGGDLHMADVAGGALGSAVEPAPEDEAGADAGAHLDEQQVVRPG